MQVKHIGYVSANIGLFFIEEHSHLFCIQPHGLSSQLDVKLEGETVWLNTKQMAVLFDKEESNIRRHITNVFNLHYS